MGKEDKAKSSWDNSSDDIFGVFCSVGGKQGAGFLWCVKRHNSLLCSCGWSAFRCVSCKDVSRAVRTSSQWNKGWLESQMLLKTVACTFRAGIGKTSVLPKRFGTNQPATDRECWASDFLHCFWPLHWWMSHYPFFINHYRQYQGTCLRFHQQRICQRHIHNGLLIKSNAGGYSFRKQTLELDIQASVLDSQVSVSIDPTLYLFWSHLR